MDLRTLLSSMDDSVRDPAVTYGSQVLVMVRNASVPISARGAWNVVPVVDIDVWEDEQCVELVLESSAGEPPLALNDVRDRLRELAHRYLDYEVCSATLGHYSGDPQPYRRDVPIVSTRWDEHGFGLLEKADEER